MDPLYCPRCAKPYPARAPDTRCPRCGSRPGDPPIVEALKHAQEAGGKLLARENRESVKRFLWLVKQEHAPRLRRCVRCDRRQFSTDWDCRACLGPTVDLDLAGTCTGRAALVRAGALRFARTRTVFSRAIVFFWVGVTVSLVELVNDHGPLGVLFYGAFLALFAVLGHAALVALGNAFLRRSVPALGGDEAALATLGERLDRVSDTFATPFLARNGIAEGAPVRGIPAPELELMRLALATEAKLTLTPEVLDSFLVACALRRDVLALGARIENASAGEARADLVQGYARTVPASEDEVTLPLLLALLASRGETMRPEALAPILLAHREDARLKGFLADLEQRRAGAGPPGPPA
jgi:hypothetical protein